METDTNTSLQIKITRPKITVDFPYGDYEIDSVDETFNLILNSDGYVKAQIDFANINLYGNIFDDKELTLDLREKYIRGSLFEIRAGTQLSLPVCYNNEDTGEIVDTGKKYTLGVIEFDPNQIKEEWKINRDFKITYGITQGATPTSSTWLKKDNWPKIKCGNHQFNTTTIKYSGGSIPVWVNNLNNIVQYQYNLNENGIDFQLSFAYDNTGVGSGNALHLTRSTPDTYITLDGNGNITTGNQKFSLEEDCVEVQFQKTGQEYQIKNVTNLDGITNGDYLFANKKFETVFDFGENLSQMTSGKYMFSNCSNLSSTISESNFNLTSLTCGLHMFYNCDDITSFTSDLNSLIDGRQMFQSCTNLGTFNSDLSSLKYGDNMFNSCLNLTKITSDSSNSPDSPVNLGSLIDGQYMFYYCTKLTTFTPDLSSLTNGRYMFYNCDSFTEFNSNLGALIYGYSMFESCSGLTSFTSDLSSLTDGTEMFNNCSKLATFISDLSSLTNGRYMFQFCSDLTSFYSNSDGSSVNLSSLIDGYNMFNGCENLTSFDSDLPSLTNGYEMFYRCENLTSFTSDLISSETNKSSLTNGFKMFSNCYKLATFTSNLSSLTDGTGMFYGCALNSDSVQKILDTIPAYTDGSVHILYMTMDKNGCDKAWDICKFYNSQYSKSKIKNYTNLQSESTIFKYKGWTIYVTTNVEDGVELSEFINPKFNIVEENGYIPNAETWNQDVNNESDTTLKQKILNITHVWGNVAKIKSLTN